MNQSGVKMKNNKTKGQSAETWEMSIITLLTWGAFLQVYPWS